MADATPKRKPLSNISNTIGTMPPPPPRPKMGKDVSVKEENVDDTDMAGNLKPDHLEQGQHVPTEARELRDANMNDGKPTAEQVNGRSKRKLECLDIDSLHEQVKELKRENEELQTKIDELEGERRVLQAAKIYIGERTFTLELKRRENEELQTNIDKLEGERPVLQAATIRIGDRTFTLDDMDGGEIDCE